MPLRETAKNFSTRPCPADAPLEISRRFAAIWLAIFLLACAALLYKQIAFSQIATSDACGYYLPLARAYAAGGAWQHPMVPPAYPLATGMLAERLAVTDDPHEFAGRIISAASVIGIVVCVYCIGWLLWSRRLGLAAAALTAVNPWIIRIGGNVGPSQMYGLFLCLAILFLVVYCQKPSLLAAVGAAVFSALAALSRSEGIFMPLLALAVPILCVCRSWRRWLRAAGHVAVIIVVVLAAWWPRLSFMRAETGMYVLDVRVLQALPWTRNCVDRAWFKLPDQVESDRRERPYRRSHTAGEVFQEAAESLVMVIGPVTWVLAGLWIVGRRKVPLRCAGQWIIAAVIVAQLAMVLPVKMDRRYVAAVAGPAQIWGGLGLIVLAERLRNVRSALRKLGESISLQMVGVSVLAAALAAWSLSMTNVGTRHVELRDLGRLIRDSEQYGPGRVIMSITPEPVYYAGGKLALPPLTGRPNENFSPAEIRRSCRAKSVSLIVIRSRDRWAGWLLRRIASGELPAGALVAARTGGGRKPVTSYLIDAEKLFAPPDIP